MSLLLLFGGGSGGPQNTVALVDFTTPAHTLVCGGNYQRFGVWLRKTSGASDPKVTLSLYEGGQLVADLATDQTVSSTTGQLFTVYWDADSLSSLAGVDVQLRIAGTASATSSVEVGAVVWEAREASTSTWTGAGAATLPLLTASGAGKKSRSGTGAATLPLLTAAGVGTSAEDVSVSGSAVVLLRAPSVQPPLSRCASPFAALASGSMSGVPFDPVPGAVSTGKGVIRKIVRVTP